MHSAHQGNFGFGNFERRGGTGRFIAHLFRVITIMSVLGSVTSSYAAGDLSLFGPKIYTRSQGKPATTTDTFSGCASGSSGILRLVNGAGKDTRVSSANVLLNGSRIIGEHDLNKNVPSLERTIALKPGGNTLSVTIKSGEGDDDDNRHDGNEHHHEKDSDVKGNKDGHDKDRHSSGGGSDKGGKDEHHDDHGKGKDDDHRGNHDKSKDGDHHEKDDDHGRKHGDNDHGERHGNDDHQHTPVFLTIEILGRNCDAIPPVISTPQPGDGALLAVARPTISVSYADNSGGSGIDTASVRVTLDGSDITPACSVTTSGATCTLSGDLTDGVHTATVALSDLVRNPATSSWRFTTDTTSPRVTVTSPQGGQYLGNPSITVTGAIDDTAATVTVNGMVATLTGLTFSVADLPLTEGVTTITVVALDQAGNRSSTSMVVTLDTSLPVVTITAPVDGSYTNIPTVTVGGSVSEALSGVTVNGRTTTLTGQAFALENLLLAEGQNTISAEALDLAGNKGSAIVTVTLDTVNPQIFVTAPVDGLLTRNPQLTVSGTVSEPLASLTINGGSVPFNGLDFTTVLTLNEGTNSIVLAAADRAGNKATATINAALDSTPPVVPVLEALPAITNNPLATLRGSAEAGSSVSLFIDYTNAGQTVADQSGLFSFPDITLTEGLTTFTAVSLDLAGNTSQISESVSVTLDTKSPVVGIAAPLDKSILNTPVITVSGTIDDPTAAVTVNGLAALNSGGIWTLEGFTLQEGSNTLLVEARDPAGNKGSATVTLTLDTVPPTVTINTPVDGLYTNIATVAVSGLTSEAVASVTVNGRTATVNGTAYSLPDLLLTEGANSMVVETFDLAGNKGQATISVTLDTIAPQLTVIGPDDGALLNNGQITFGGSAAEPVVSVLVNGIAAQAGTNGYTLPLTLIEGSNTLTVTAIDRAGNQSTSIITVNLDSTAPAAPLLDPLATQTRIATTTVSGQAEPLVTVKLFNNGQQFASLTADTAGQFTAPNITLIEGNNPFTATATDAAGNSSQPSAPLTVVLDTKPPVITVTAPQPGALVSTPQVTITGMVDEPLASLTVNGGAATLTDTVFEYVMALAAGENGALITATDLAGNVATATVTVQRDSTPPKVTIIAPLNGLLTNNPQIQVSGTVDDAEATLTVAGAPVTVTNKSFSVSYVLTDGENSIHVTGVDRAGNEGTASVQVILDAQPPAVTLNAPATATAGTDVQISVSATDNRGLSLVDLSADGASLWSVAPTGESAAQSVSLRLSPTFTPGATVTVRARALDAAGNSGSATTVITIDKGADGPGWLQGKVLDDSRGLPLQGVQVQVTDVNGSQQSITTPADGAWFFELPSGPTKVEVIKGGFTTVRRDVTVRPGQRTSVLDSRLTKIDGTVNTIDASGGAVKSTSFKIQNSSFTIDLSIPASALAAPADVRLTPLSNQGLIAPLPLGWSPLAVADVRLLDPITAAVIEPQPLAAVADLTFPLPKGLGDNALTAQLARYDNSSRSWLAAAEVAIAAKATTAGAAISRPGQYALVLADPAPASPPAPVIGQELAAAELASTDFILTSTAGRVVPQAAIPSVGLRAAGDLLLVARADAAPAPALISGLVVNARVTEKFDLTGGDKLQPIATVQDLVLYRTPCATAIAGGSTEPFDPAAGLRTTFPVSPSRDFTIVDLLLGKISIEITQPDTSGGVMVGADGARLLQPDGTALSIPAGALSGTAPVTVTTLPAASVSALVGADFRLLRGVDIAIGGQSLKSSATLSIPAPSGFDPALPVVVAKKFDVKGGSRLKLVAAGTVTGSIISSAAITAGNETIATQGITTSGQYLFLQATAPIGYVTGQAIDAAAAPFAGIHISAQSATLADQTAANGNYLIALAAGARNITALDPTRGDAASGSVTIGANTRSTLNLTVRMVPPTVLAITPANGAINVQTDVAVTATFSKSMDKSTVTNDTFILRDAAIVIPGVITWNAETTGATFYPAESFKQETAYSVTIAAAVKDLQGYSLGQDVSSTFSVRRTTPPVMPAAGAISGTFPDADGFITVTGTQGSAAADNTVLLINDTTGEIQSVTPASNGLFTGKVRGQLGDQIKVVLMDYSGNQTTISYLTFKGPNGSYLVTAKGGKIEGEGGSILDIPEGALVGSTIIKVTTVQEANLPNPLHAPGKFLGAVNIDTGGTPFQKAVEISIPIPAGFNTNNAVFITKPGQIYNADDTTEQVYEIIDSTKIVGNRITSACEPFPGVFGGTLIFTDFPDLTPIVISGYTYQDRNDLPSYQAPPEGLVETPDRDITTGNLTYKYDRPIQGAVIRSPDAWNYVSYTNSKGFYGTFASMSVLPAGFAGPDANCKRYRISAVNPQTMFKWNFDGYACAPPYNVRDVNFKLADKGTVPPDKTKPTIEATIKVAPIMGSEYRIVSGTVPINTKLVFPVSVTDEDIKSATLVVNFKGDDGATGNTPVTMVRPPTSVVVRNITRGIDVPVYRTDFITQFNSDPTKNYFLADQPGVYTFVVEAKDNSGSFDLLARTIRVIAPGGVLPTGREGAPTVDAVSPLNQKKNIPVNSPVVVTFSEPVGNITDNTFQLIDLDAVPATSNPVPATVSVTLAGNRTVATLTPKYNLWFGHTYKVVLSTGIKDENVNTTAPPPYAPPDGDGRMPLAQQYESTFTTIMPDQHDLGVDEQFSGGRDIDLYEFTTSSGDQKTYAYVAAGDNGWRAVDVSDPSTPLVLSSKTMTGAGVTWSYRGVSVNPASKIMGMTDSITYSDGNQYGYVRFYDLNENPETPQIVGREKLAEAYSGIPGRLALFGDYAYVATTIAGVQVVDVKAAIERQRTGGAADGSTIVSVFDSMGQGYGSPNDVAVFNAQKALVTTNSGYLLPLDIAAPYYPILMTAYRPTNTSFIRAAIAPEYEYTDENGLDNKIDLAVAATRDGKLVTIDMTDAYNPGIMGTATNDVSSQITTAAMDISIVPKEWLAFVTTLDKIKVFDIKDPHNPKLRNEFQPAADPDATAPLAAIGQTPAIIAREGWIYMANMRQGLRTMGVNANDIKVYNENKIQVSEIGYSKGDEQDRRYYVEVKFNDPEIICGNDDLEGKMVIKTRRGGAVNPLPGIDHPTQYLLSFRKGTDGLCYADLKNMATSSVKNRFIATNFPASDPTLSTALTTVAPVFGSIGTKAIFELSNRNDGRLMKRKAINLEKLIRIAFDGNRDGVIDFKKQEDKSYSFWLNDDHDDISRDTDGLSNFWGYDTQDDLLDTSKDFYLGSNGLGVIKTTRDVEDFSRLHLQVDDHASEVIKRASNNSTKFKFYLVFKNTNTATPEIGLYMPDNPSDKYLFQIDPLKPVDADDRADEAFKLVGREAYKIIMKDLANEIALDTVGSNQVTPYIFEGRKEGKGDLTLVLKSEDITIEENSASLDLHPITWFYDHFDVTYNDTMNTVNPYIEPEIPAGYPAKDNDYVLFVHGWNMKNLEKNRWAETMFKRLWWLGYTGKVGLFSWPTLTGPTTFDSSELRSWQSSDALKRVLTYRLRDNAGKIRILAHSLGNIAAGEALNKLPGTGIVKTYVASQAALSANYYENSIPETDRANWNVGKPMLLPEYPVTPNIMGSYNPGGPQTSGKPYFSDVPGKVNKIISYYNRKDWALTNGATGIFAWEVDQKQKPDVGYVYCNRDIGCATGNGTIVQFTEGAADALLTQDDYFAKMLSIGVEQELRLPQDRYEIFSKIIQSRVKAAGSTDKLNNVFNNNSVDLSLLCGYDEKHYSHSKQFRSSIAEQNCYWKQIMIDMELPATNREVTP